MLKLSIINYLGGPHLL